MKPDIWINGQFVPWNKAHIHPLCHSLQRGATLFESIDCVKAENGNAAIFRLNDHMQRFENSSRIIGMPLEYSIEELTDAVIKTVERSGLKSCTIRPLAIYSDPVMDIYPGDSKISVIIGIGEKNNIKEFIKMKISRLRKIDSDSMPVKAKVSGNYIGPLIAKSEAIRDGFDDTIILDRDGFVAEGSTSNFFIIENGTLITAPDDKILQGITRNTIMVLSEKLGVNLVQAQFSPERFKTAEEAFISSSGNGVLPVIQVDNVKISNGKVGTITRRLRSYYIDVIMGRVPEFNKWLTYI